MYSTLIITENTELELTIEEIISKDHSFKKNDYSKSFSEAEKKLQKENYQLVLIKIDTNPINLLKWLKNNLNHDTELIIFHCNSPFINDFLNFNLSAFIDVKEIHNLLKPALIQAKNSINKRLEKQKRLETLLKIVSHTPQIKISLAVKNGIELVNSSDIISITATKNSSEINLSDGRIIKINKSINEFEVLLEDLSFLRIHRSHLINLAHIKQYIRKNGGSIEMSNSSVFSLSLNKKSIFLKQLQRFSLNTN